MRIFAKIFLCYLLNDHDWTSKAEQGEKPTPAQTAAGVAGFWEYARMYCRRCGHVSELSLEAEQQSRLREMWR